MSSFIALLRSLQGRLGHWLMTNSFSRVGSIFGFSLEDVSKASPDSRLVVRSGTTVDSEDAIFTQFLNRSAETHRASVRAVKSPQFYEFENATIQLPNRVACVSVGSDFVVCPPQGSRPSYRIFRGFGASIQGGIIWQRDHQVLLRRRRSTAHEQAIYVGGWGENWYMWLSTTLSAIYLAKFLPKQFSGWPIALPSNLIGRRNWIESLELLAPGREILYLPKHQPAKFSRLVWVEPPLGRGPLPRAERIGSELDYVHIRAMQKFATDLLGKVPRLVAEELLPESIFIYRGPNASRPHNEEELLEVAKRFGAVPVDFSKLTFEETVRCIRSAKLLVGSHGAGWVNLMFATPGTKAVYWVEDAADPNPNFVNLASIFGVDFHVLEMAEAPSAQKRQPANSRRLEPWRLEQKLSALVGP